MKTKPQFAIGDLVMSDVSTGTVTEIGTYADHSEYLVTLPDKTASWIHESKLTAANAPETAAAPATANVKKPKVAPEVAPEAAQ